MSATAFKPTAADNSTTPGRPSFLDLGAGRVLSANPDGSDLKTIISEGRKLPDGLAVDVAVGHIYFGNMGDPFKNDGSILRSDLDGKNIITIVPPGGTFTPKQVQLDKKNGKLYWSDREGMRVMRSNLDGSKSSTTDLIFGSRRLEGSLTGNSATGDTTLKFSVLSGVSAMIENVPLEQAAEAYAKMMAGKARFRMVLTMNDSTPVG